MLRRIIVIKNVGRFRNSAATPNPTFAKHTFVFGANGYGKSTLCTVLRSVESGDGALVVGRKSLGASEPQIIDLLFTGGNHRFANGSWSSTEPLISIFDATFLSENVHSGDVVDITNKRNLYRIIVGRDGVALAEREQILAEESRNKQTMLTAAEKNIRVLTPRSMSSAEFVALKPLFQIDEKIKDQKQKIVMLREAAAILAHVMLQECKVNTNIELSDLLGRSLDDIADDIESQLAAHVARHGMAAAGQRWIAEGVAFIAADECPFCGRAGVSELLPVSQTPS